MNKGRVNTKLGHWLKIATKEQQEELCQRTGTSMNYLRLLSNAHRENPKVRLALSLVKEANAIAIRDSIKSTDAKWFPQLFIEDLATPTRRGGNDE